jgi:cyclopropane-fatty-acyl-phospholipid synthase
MADAVTGVNRPNVHYRAAMRPNASVTVPSTRLSSRISRKLAATNYPVTVRMPDGSTESFGDEPRLEVVVLNDRGLKAIQSLSELSIVNAYLSGDLDLVGDLVGGMDLRNLLTDTNAWIKAWTVIQPILVGRRRLNPGWVAKHYDSQNIQVYAIDQDYQMYTPGLYLSDDDSLEEGAERKLEYAFHALNLGDGGTVLDVGCGWGGFARYCTRRGVSFTGISLSRHQLEYARRSLDAEGLDAQLLYQDFFTFEPGRQFDAISLMGSIEELADYPKVMHRLSSWLKPGGLIYLDFAAVDRRFGVASFVTKYVWPGSFRMVHLPSFTSAFTAVEFDIVDIRNDRRNYYLWAKSGYERWMRRRDEIVEAADERTWRLMRLLMAGTAHLMSQRSAWATAYRVVLERRSAPALDGTSVRVFDRLASAEPSRDGSISG